MTGPTGRQVGKRSLDWPLPGVQLVGARRGNSARKKQKSASLPLAARFFLFLSRCALTDRLEEA